MRNVLGIIVIVGITYLLSNNRKKISWGQVIWGIAVQGLLALTILKTNIWGVLGLLTLLYSCYAYNMSHLFTSVKSWWKNPLTFITYILAILGLGYLERSFGFTGILYQIFLFLVVLYLILKSANRIQSLALANYIGVIYIILFAALVIGQGMTGATLIQDISKGVGKFLSANRTGGQFVFGKLMTNNGFVFALSIISSTVFFAAVMNILDYLGITTAVVNSMARFTSWSMQIFKVPPISGVESLVSTSNIFLSMESSPLLIRKYLPKITQSEVVTIIVTGLATIAGSTMAIFINAGVPAEYLIAASVMSTPAAICLAKILCPETEIPETLGTNLSGHIEKSAKNVLGAATDGIIVGMRSGALITVMIMGLLSLIALGNQGFAFLDKYIDGYLLPSLLRYQAIPLGESFQGIVPPSLERLFAYIGIPMAWLLGTPIQEVSMVGELLGLKVAVNEAVAYTKMLEFIKLNLLSEKSIIIASYALCGFANVGSLGILIGVMTGVVPERKEDFIKFGLKGMFVGALASFMTAAFVSMLF